MEAVSFYGSVAEGCKDADIIAPMFGYPWESRRASLPRELRILQPYQVNDTAFSYAKDSTIFLHCLPAFHNARTEIGAKIYKQFGISEMEVSDSVF